MPSLAYIGCQKSLGSELKILRFEYFHLFCENDTISCIPYFIKFTHLENEDNNIMGLVENLRDTVLKNNSLKIIKQELLIIRKWKWEYWFHCSFAVWILWDRSGSLLVYLSIFFNRSELLFRFHPVPSCVGMTTLKYFSPSHSDWSWVVSIRLFLKFSKLE